MLSVLTALSVKAMDKDPVSEESEVKPGIFTRMAEGLSSAYAYSKQMSSAFQMTLDPEICRNDPVKVTRALFRYFNTNFFHVKKLAHPAFSEFLEATRAGENDDILDGNPIITSCYGLNAKTILTHTIEFVLNSSSNLMPDEIVIKGNVITKLPVDISHLTHLISKLAYDDPSSSTGITMWDEKNLRTLYSAWIHDIEINLLLKVKMYQTYIKNIVGSDEDLKMAEEKIDKDQKEIERLRVGITHQVDSVTVDEGAAEASSALLPPPPPPPLPQNLLPAAMPSTRLVINKKEANLESPTLGARMISSSGNDDSASSRGGAITLQTIQNIKLKPAQKSEPSNKIFSCHDGIYAALLNNSKFMSLKTQHEEGFDDDAQSETEEDRS